MGWFKTDDPGHRLLYRHYESDKPDELLHHVRCINIQDMKFNIQYIAANFKRAFTIPDPSVPLEEQVWFYFNK